MNWELILNWTSHGLAIGGWLAGSILGFATAIVVGVFILMLIVRAMLLIWETIT